MEIVFIRWEPPRIIRRSLTEAADEKFIGASDTRLRRRRRRRRNPPPVGYLAPVIFDRIFLFFFYLFSSLLHLFLFSLARHDVSYLEDRNGGRASKSRRPILAGRVVTSDLHPKSGWHVERVSVARRRRLYCQSLGRRFRPETKIASYRFTIFRNAYGVRSFAGREKGRGRKKESKS